MAQDHKCNTIVEEKVYIMSQALLSPYHKIFYMEWKIDPSRSDYNIVFDQTLNGPINVPRLAKAVRHLISEHVVFNSHVEEKGGTLYWKINNKIYELKYIENQLPNDVIWLYIKEPFNLSQGPLYRFYLIKNCHNNHRLIIILHHLIIDGNTIDYFVDELSSYYNNPLHKNSISVPEQLLTLSELSDKLCNKISMFKDKGIMLWKEQLTNIESLDADFLKPIIYKSNNTQKNLEHSILELGEKRFTIDQKPLSKLKQLIGKQLTTPYLYSQNIFALLLYRYTGQKKFCITYPIAIREATNFLYGSNINTNIIPYDFSKINNFLDIINQTTRFFEDLNNGSINYSRLPIYDIMSGDKNAFNYIFAQQNLRYKVFEFNDVKAIINHGTNINIPNQGLIFEQDIQNNTLLYRVRYNLKKFDTCLLNDFVVLYQRLFEEVLDELISIKDVNKLKHINQYNLLQPEQYQKIIIDWNNTDKSFPSDKTISQLFEEQVVQTPNNIALVFEDTELTYQALNKKANQLAHYLIQAYSIKPDTLVALCLDRNKHMLISILAVLKAGGAYVPIDPSYPDERIKYILEDTNAKVILTNKIYRAKIEDIARKDQQIQILDIDNEIIQERLLMQVSTNIKTVTTSTNLAYVIYTSGTTGNPKGVMIEHRGVVNLAILQGREFGLIDTDSIKNCLWYNNYTFDAHVWDVYTVLFHGHRLHLVGNNIRMNIKLLHDYIKTNYIDIATIPPALLDNKDLLPLDILVVTGEKTSKDVLHCYYSNNVTVLNGYGPTEVTVGVSINKYNDNGSNNVGLPMSNTKCYILDANLMPLPIGCIGELYIGGVGVARGYLNDPELTAEKFVPNPFQSVIEKQSGKNLRLYKTGDLMRWLPDGNLEYIGRNDHQIKIRGYRIELEEIENAILGYDGIKQCVVLVKEHIGNKYLVGYYVSDNKINEDNILNFLQKTLPDYMVPSMLIHIEKISLTINGKLDIKALPSSEFTIKDNYVAPRNELEKQLCKIWIEVLNLPSHIIGVHDSFFRLGGNSMLVITLLNKINKELAPKIDVPAIFKHNTISKLSDYITHSFECVNSGEKYVF